MEHQIILQDHYRFIEIDASEKDIVQIWQNSSVTSDVIQIERENIQELIDILKKEIK